MAGNLERAQKRHKNQGNCPPREKRGWRKWLASNRRAAEPTGDNVASCDDLFASDTTFRPA
jgi:hypothetical protein